MELDLHNTEWDCCVVGNGVAALWVAHWMWSSKKSVLWITSEEPYGPERAMLQHGWAWGIDRLSADALVQELQGFENSMDLSPLEVVYFDARSSKRFRRFGEAKQEWGAHEKEYFNKLASQVAGDSNEKLDLWAWHSKLCAFHETGASSGPTTVELFKEPRFVRVQGWPLIELKTQDKKITSAVLSGFKASQPKEIRARQFFLSDFDEYLPGLIKDADDSQTLATALKGRAYRAGFGLKLWHKDLESSLQQTAVVPLLVNPAEKEGASHVLGRFLRQDSESLQSVWVGLLTDEEVEDNNEILKKIKQTKRAVERAIPGFVGSITREAVTFEPRMLATDLVKNRKDAALGAVLLSDHNGSERTAESVVRVFRGSENSGTKTKSRSKDPEVGV
ncbi:MAG: hypothetical protein AB1540_14280 [Bdellovibrionota bacterium]